MRRVYTAHALLDAYLVRDLLIHAGTAARVLNEHARSGLGEIPFDAAQPQVWIDRDEDEQRALALVREFEHRRTIQGVVYCRACGEENPANFELCWKCRQGL
jgi:Putative prokaryotic signal transducing protein